MKKKKFSFPYRESNPNFLLARTCGLVTIPTELSWLETLLHVDGWNIIPFATYG
jgi:hypothetical protein